MRRAAVAGALVTLLWIPAPAGAHAVLVDTQPGDGEVVEVAPDEVLLVFSEPMQQPASMRVTGSRGQVLVDGSAVVDGARVLMPLAPPPGKGVHTVTWRAVSADDHLVEGTFSFTVVPAAAPAPGDASQRGDLDPDHSPSPDARTPVDAAPADPAPPPAGAGADGAGRVGLLLAAAAALAVLSATAAAVARRR